MNVINNVFLSFYSTLVEEMKLCVQSPWSVIGIQFCCNIPTSLTHTTGHQPTTPHVITGTLGTIGAIVSAIGHPFPTVPGPGPGGGITGISFPFS